MPANAYVIAGSNGAGKTTFARKFLPKYADCREFLNADMVAAGLSPFNPDAAAVSAGRVLLARMKELIRQGKSFGFETTLAGKTYVATLRTMKDQEYRLHLYYLWVPRVELAIARVAHRVEHGGHNVPERVVRRRFSAGLQNLWKLYLPLFDTWHIFDNSTPRPRMIARHVAGETEVLDVTIYEKILNVLQE